MPAEVQHVIEPGPCEWAHLIEQAANDQSTLSGRPLSDWRRDTRQQLGLRIDRPILATGHQTLLWHPGILAKYFAVEGVARRCGYATANLVVDQHVDQFGSFEIPTRRSGGSLATRTFHLLTPRPSVPMSLHDAVQPRRPSARLMQSIRANDPTGTVADGVDRIFRAVIDHASADNAAMQMAGALSDLMSRWVRPMPSVSSTTLVQTSLSRELLVRMADDPQHCAQLYNRALREAGIFGIGSLLVRDDYVEMPLWRIREDGRRMHAYDSDIQRWLDGEAITLMPRALFLTAMVRLGMADLFVHGTGGGAYDVAMERWIQSWLGITPAPSVVVSATLHLPLMEGKWSDDASEDMLARTRRDLRRAWHDPDGSNGNARPGPGKQQLLDAIEAAERGSVERRQAFFAMHRAMDVARTEHADDLEALRHRIETLERTVQDQTLASRRDWPFPLYSDAQLDALAAVVRCDADSAVTDPAQHPCDCNQ